jgi:DNA-directed RNA polymerase specialized sigma24 family protein
MDFLRSRFGRHDPPSGYATLTPEDREVFRLYYLEGLSLADVLERRAPPLAWARAWDRGGSERKEERSADALHGLVDSLRRIEAAIGPRALQRYSEDAEARSVGIAAGRLLQYLEHVRREAGQQQQAHTPEAAVLRQEVEEARGLVRRLVQQLPDEDRLAVRLWYFRGWGAEDLSRAMGLPNRRKAYTVVQRALRRLRRLVLAAGYDPRERVVGHPPAAAPDEPRGS